MSGLTPRQSAGPLGRARGLTRAVASAVASVLAVGLAGSAAADADAPLYRWTDRSGVVRYTPHPDRIPGDLRGSAVRVEPGILPPAAPSAQPAPLPSPSAATAEPRGAGGEAAEPAIEPDPFNAPERAPRVEAEQITRTGRADSGTNSELDLRIHQLEEAIARDEERLKELISLASADGSDPLLDSPELREIARRLPELQTDLRALRARRDRR